jgi:hypothetical protein
MHFVAIIKMCYISFEKKFEDIFLYRQLSFFFFFLVFLLCMLLVNSNPIRNCYIVCAYFRAAARTFQVLAR